MTDYVISDVFTPALKQLVCQRGHVIPISFDAPLQVIAYVQACPKTINQGPPCGARADWRRTRPEVPTV